MFVHPRVLVHAILDRYIGLTSDPGLVLAVSISLAQEAVVTTAISSRTDGGTADPVHAVYQVPSTNNITSGSTSNSGTDANTSTSTDTNKDNNRSSGATFGQK
ncbi:hypothetical protein I302_102424 [Kwoniella bestiolae CBS 10118]|uniref:Uncharacterized protein n=1 Tax=Kwoniella bestiolae CBS 10118 TaxID=1296100 RepID=A0A1B9GF58_9TREE|nr:hypothetical protein I302_01114 [Kwoniella bestiolae CBS 10118]OCF29605.1 hypothetical protein I302_01114 [Kwoniella bestiolae CBS 10118]